MFHYNQCCEGVERTNSTFRASNLQVILLTRESESALDGKRLLNRDRVEGGAGGALAPPLFCKKKNKLNKNNLIKVTE